jgi:hypothetical protein
LVSNSSMYSNAPESIEEAILIKYRGIFELKSMIIFWNANTHARSSLPIKPSVFLKIIDLNFFKNESIIDIDWWWATLWIMDDNYGEVI